jgi:hypothetical protein
MLVNKFEDDWIFPTSNRHIFRFFHYFHFNAKQKVMCDSVNKCRIYWNKNVRLLMCIILSTEMAIAINCTDQN